MSLLSAAILMMIAAVPVHCAQLLLRLALLLTAEIVYRHRQRIAVVASG